jgi:hypothetical protein
MGNFVHVSKRWAAGKIPCPWLIYNPLLVEGQPRPKGNIKNGKYAQRNFISSLHNKSIAGSNGCSSYIEWGTNGATIISMKPIISRLVTLIPIILGIVLCTYLVEEFTEEMINDTLSDLIFPIGGLVILVIIWLYLVPTIQAYLATEEKSLE